MTASHIVAPSAIQSALNDLWNAKENKNKIRASLFNLIFFTRKSPREEYLHKIAHKLLEKFPSRVFFITSDPSCKELQTSVAVISTQQGDFEITCDLIEITAGREVEEQVPFLLFAHLTQDLPVFLVWAEDPSEDYTLFENIKPLCTRVIFESESAESLEKFANSVLEKHRSNAFEIADLNWARVEGWRTILSSMLGQNKILPKLADITTLTIAYNVQETPFFCHTKIQAIYLQAWIAVCLGWKKGPSSPSDACALFFYEFADKKIRVQLVEKKEEKIPPGMILSVTFQTQEGESLVFSRESTALEQISFEHTTPTECSLILRKEVSKGESGQSLVKEICHKGTNPHYIEVLELILRGGCPC